VRVLSKPIFLFFILILVSVFMAPFFAHFDPNQSHLESALRTPSTTFFLGTDANGRDIFSQILFGSRLSLLISMIVVFNCLFVGVIAGFLAGYLGGLIDRAFLLVADVFQAFPGILLAICIAAFLPPSVKNLIILLSFVGWVSYARVVRAQVIEMKSREFIMAGLAIGVSRRRLLWRHFLPNMMAPLIVQASFGMAGVILAESTLSFLGLGLPDHIPSLGKLMDSGVGLLLVAPHVALFPGLVIMLFVLFFNLMGDWLREKVI
jgi:peptide/nickel transport system permease protein